MKSLYDAYKDGTLSPEKVLSRAREQVFGTSNPGFCINEGSEHEGVEPDARALKCDVCGLNSVYGAEELVLMGQMPDDNNPAKVMVAIEGDLAKIAEMG